MAIIRHYRRGEDGLFTESLIDSFSSPAEFVLSVVPNGVPFRCYRGVCDITRDVDAMLMDGEFSIIESPGKSVLDPFSKFNDPLGFNRKLKSYLIPKVDSPNQQAQSSNNSLTDRTNKPRPYDRVFDICGTVQSIPSDMMQAYKKYSADHKEFEYGYYYIARGPVETPESGITDGDTLFSSVSGASANIYDPFTSPNNSAPRQVIGSVIDEDLYVTIRSNEIDGITLRAPNEFQTNLSNIAVASISGIYGTISDGSGDASFSDFFVAGDSVRLTGVRTWNADFSARTVLDGVYVVTSVSETSITIDVTSNLAAWQAIYTGSYQLIDGEDGIVAPSNTTETGFTEWVTINKISPERLMVNIVATNGLYKRKTKGPKSTSVTAQLQYQLLDESNNPVGPVYSVSKTMTDNSTDQCGMSIEAVLPTQSAVRVRARRSSNKDFGYSGTISDEIVFRDLYGQIKDTTPHYGDMTTIHTVRKQTVQATAIKEPQLKVIATEMVYKYLGGGVFDSVRTPNTQAVQSLIRMMRDPLVGNLDLSSDCMDVLLGVQSSIESYFGSELAGQFCYTFDSATDTAQDIAQTIANAIFCTTFRENGNDIRLHFERPVSGPAMVFTHRSKVGAEKWSRSFGSDSKDCVEFSYIDPKTNIRETITIPAEGGINPNKIDSKGVRNYQQAYWLAHRARQKDILQRVGVEFSSTEEGLYVVAGQPISVVKGSRVATYDGYIVAQNSMTLTLSQEVEFTDGDDHYIQLKRRDGTVESVRVEPGANARTVLMLSAPSEAIYTGNSAVKTEFSFGNEARHLAQMIIPITVDPQSDKTVKITGSNYHPDIYLYDGAKPLGKAFSNGFSNGFN